MFVEDLSAIQRGAAQQAHQEMTEHALVHVFELARDDAHAAVRDMWERLQASGTPQQVESARERILHLDPVDVAADIAGVTPDQVDRDRLMRFDKEYRQELERSAETRFRDASTASVRRFG